MRRGVAVLGSSVLIFASFSVHPGPHQLTFAELTCAAARSLARHPPGNVWFAGNTCSQSLPTTPDALQNAALPAASSTTIVPT
jgi:hypothetical protein